MEDYQEKTYNKDQRAVANEVLETFGTLIEKLSSAQDITVCSSSVQELLCDDFFDFNDYFQPDLCEDVRVYITQLQGLNKARLCSLNREISTLRCNLQDSKEWWNEMIKTEQDTDEYCDFLAITRKIIQGLIYNNPNVSELSVLVKKMKIHRMQNRDVLEINKREIGKMIRDYTGNEGSNDNPDLCRPLQTCLDFLQTESKAFWENASFTIYDPEENMYKITSGTRRHQFICRMKNGEPFIMKKKVVSHYIPKHRQLRNFPFQCQLL